MEIKVIPIEEIKPAKYNPRTDLKPGDEVYERLKQSILRFELVEPLVWNKRTGNLVGGHQRLKVLRELGYTEVEVSVVDLDEEQEKVLNLALNKIQGEWDKEKLEVLLKELYEQDKESVYLAGFNDAELRKLVDSIAVEQSPYTYKVDSVQYLPREGARLEELCDTGKYEELLKKIEEADVSAMLGRMLMFSAFLKIWRWLSWILMMR